MYNGWILVAALILLGLGCYAGYLLVKLKKQKIHIAIQKQQAEDKRAEVLNDIRYIAQALLDDRCELSEAVVRIVNLFAILSLSERVATEFPATFSHFDVIKTHPIMENRKALTKQARMKLDLERMKSEAQLEKNILKEAEKLAHFSLKPTH